MMNEATTTEATVNTRAPYRELPTETTTVNAWVLFWTERVRLTISMIERDVRRDATRFSEEMEFANVLRVFSNTIRHKWIEYAATPEPIRESILLGEIDRGLEEIRDRLEPRLAGFGSNHQLYSDRDTIYH